VRNLLCKFNGVAVMRKILGISGRANRSAVRIGSMVVCVRKFEARSLLRDDRGAPDPQVVGSNQ